MTFFNWGSENGSIVSSYIWIYFLITAIFTVATLVLWWYFLVYRVSKKPGAVLQLLVIFWKRASLLLQYTRGRSCIKKDSVLPSHAEIPMQ